MSSSDPMPAQSAPSPLPIPDQPQVPPTLRTVLRNLINNEAMTLMKVCQVGIIQKYDPDTQTAVVALTIRQTNLGVIQAQIMLYDVPVLVPPTFLSPILAGEYCLLVVCDQDTSAWWNGTDNQVPPSTRRHDYSDAFAIVGVRPKTDPVAAGYNNADTIVQNENPTPEGQALGDTIVQNTGGSKNVRIRTDQAATEITLNSKVKIANINADLLTVLESILNHLIGLSVVSGSLSSGTVANLNADIVNLQKILYT